jgi:hypothetical protein
MNLTLRQIRCSLLLATTIAGAGASKTVCAQGIDDFVETDNRPEPEAKKADRDRHPFFANVLRTKYAKWIRSEFGTLDKALGRLEAALAKRFDELELCCDLTDSQRRKLSIAGQGDIKRFMDRLDRFGGSLDADEMDEEEFERRRRELGDLQSAVHDELFGDDSLFAKTLGKTLAPDQLAAIEASRRDQLGFRHRRAIVSTAKSLEGVLGLDHGQRQRLERLLVADTHPPRKYGKSDYAFVMYLTSRLPKTKLKPIFDESQWTRLVEQLTSWSAIEEFLKNDGFILAEGPGRIPFAVVQPVVAPERIER